MAEGEEELRPRLSQGAEEVVPHPLLLLRPLEGVEEGRGLRWGVGEEEGARSLLVAVVPSASEGEEGQDFPSEGAEGHLSRPSHHAPSHDGMGGAERDVCSASPADDLPPQFRRASLRNRR